MSVSLTRALLATTLAGSSLLLAAAPAGASGTGLTATPAGEARTAAAAGPTRPAVVEGADDASLARSAVGFRVANARCAPNAVLFSANTYETGFSGVQRFRHRAQLQEFTARGWVNRSPLTVQPSTRFPDDGRSFSFARDWRGAHAANGASWRVKWQGQYLDGRDRVVAATRWVTVTCA